MRPNSAADCNMIETDRSTHSSRSLMRPRPKVLLSDRPRFPIDCAARALRGIGMVSAKSAKKGLSRKERAELLQTLENRFAEYPERHERMDWALVQARLEAKPLKLWSLQQMEASGGEPDVVAFDKKTGEYVFYDCSAETPRGRRSLCYDRAALNARKEHKPKGSAVDVAASMGIELLDEAEYRALQQLGHFDAKTSSWLKTPAAIRKLGGAIFGDFRFGHVFIYHNGAESYYGVRGFRGSLRV